MHRKLILAGLTAALIAAPAAFAGSDDDNDNPRGDRQTLAIIGDTPYGEPQISQFPADIAKINADPNVERVIHVGDIKNGSTRCDTSYFEARLADFGRFEDPLVYTPGDNEWTDCHRANNGAYLPTERLAEIRRLFFAEPGRTLGQRQAKVRFQSEAFPENVRWFEDRVVFGAVHVVGSNDNLAPWFRDRGGETPAETALRTNEHTARRAATLDWINAIFDDAVRRRAAGVVIAMQADMYDRFADPAAFAAIKALIAERAARLRKPVLLLQGDSHRFIQDTPADMPPNVVRVVVQGATESPHEWLRLHVNPKTAGVFSCERVPFTAGLPIIPCTGLLAPAPPRR